MYIGRRASIAPQTQSRTVPERPAHERENATRVPNGPPDARRRVRADNARDSFNTRDGDNSRDGAANVIDPLDATAAAVVAKHAVASLRPDGLRLRPDGRAARPDLRRRRLLHPTRRGLG
jgi:hypothetical protein